MTEIDYTAGTEWLNNLPENFTAERDQYVLEAAKNGLLQVEWAPITSTYQNHTAIFHVCSDALWVDATWTVVDNNGHIADENNKISGRFRPQVSAKLAQEIADVLELSFITAKISDLAYLQSTKISMTSLAAGADMVLTWKSKEFNQLVEGKRSGTETLLRDVGKSWLIDNALQYSAGAVNYGFYDPHAPYINPQGIKMYQTIGTRHNQGHSDYSQVLFLMQTKCQVDGVDTDIYSVMKDPVLSNLINYSGILKYTRQP